MHAKAPPGAETRGVTAAMAGNGLPAAVVASVCQTGLNLMRDLTRKGVTVAGIDSDPARPGFRSVYGRSFVCPDPEARPEAWLDFMRAFSRHFPQRPVLIPAADVFVSALGRFASELEEHYLFPARSAALQAALVTKDELYPLARAAGFPCPSSTYVRNEEELRRFGESARFPCLLKPRRAREWKDLPARHPLRGEKLGVAGTPERLLEIYRSVQAVRPEAIAQEVIEGPDDAKYVYLSVYGSDATNLGCCVVRELRAEPNGSASMVEPVVDEEIESLCDGFLRGLGYVGLCEIEMKRDARDGRAMLIEVNPRMSGTGDCARYMGVEVGWLHYLDMIGQPPPPVAPTRLGFRHVTVSREAVAVPTGLRSGALTWMELLRSYRPPLAFYDLDFRDFRVTMAQLIGSARSMAGTIRRRAPRPEAL